MIDLTFKIGSIGLKLKELLGSSKEELKELLNFIKSSDPSHKIYEPIDDDIVNDNDKWVVYMAFNDGFIIEFLEDKLIYIAFDLRFLDKEIIRLPTFFNNINSIEDLDIEGEFNHDDSCFQTIIDSSIVLAFLLDDDFKKNVNVIAFGDLTVFSDENNLPNRYSEVLGGLFIG